MALRKEKRHGEYADIPRLFDTAPSHACFKSLRETQTASISGQITPGKATSLSSQQFGPIWPSFGRLGNASLGNASLDNASLDNAGN